MTISDTEVHGKAYFKRIPPDLLVLVVLLLSCSLAFGLGILAGKDMAKTQGKDGFWIEQLPEKVPAVAGPAAAVQALQTAPEPALPEPKVYVASKNGTKYYLPTCGTAKRIKEENRVWFASKEEAEATGYQAAQNCPGL